MELMIRRANRGEGARIAALARRVLEEMSEETKIWFSIDAIDEEAARIDSGEDFGYVAEDIENGGRLAGVFMVEFPGTAENNLGHYVNFSEEQLNQVAHMDTAAVLSSYRGQKLQRRLMETAEAELKALGYRYLMCTVHPDNPYSRGNLEDMGYRKVWEGLKYGGKPRLAMLKEI